LDYTLWPFWIDTHATPPLRAAPAPSSQAPANDPAAAIHAGVTTAAIDDLGEEFRFYADVPQILHFLPIAGIRLAVASRTTTPELARDLLRLLHVPSAVAIGQAQARNGTYTETQASAGGQQQQQQATAENGESGAAPGANRTPAKLSTGTTGTTATSDKNTATGPVQKPAGGAATLTKRDTRSRRALDYFDAGLEMYPRSKLWHMEMIQRRTEIPYEQMLFFDDESRNREVERLGVTMWLVRDGVTWAEVERGIRSWRTRKGLDKVV
jgi:magnesium-dependent phosphatase 1